MRSGRHLVLLLGVLLWCGAGQVSWADGSNSWTNVAGHVLEAAPQAIQGPTIVFVKEGSGQTVEYPLAVFTPAEQERLRSRLQETTVPEGLQSACEYARRILTRTHLLHDNGQMSDEEYRKSTERTFSSLRQQAAPLVEQQKLSPERLELILSGLAKATE
jgi:hypothetical protein